MNVGHCEDRQVIVGSLVIRSARHSDFQEPVGRPRPLGWPSWKWLPCVHAAPTEMSTLHQKAHSVTVNQGRATCRRHTKIHRSSLKGSASITALSTRQSSHGFCIDNSLSFCEPTAPAHTSVLSGTGGAGAGAQGPSKSPVANLYCAC